MNEKTKKVFSPRPMISFRSPRKVSGYLVKAKLHRLDRILGSTRCGQKCCEVCVNVSETNTFISNFTGESNKKTHKIYWRITTGFVFCPVSVQETTCMLWKQLTALGIDGITIRIMIEIILIMSTVNKNNFLNILIAWYTMAFVKVTDKTDGKNPKKREDYWRRT